MLQITAKQDIGSPDSSSNRPRNKPEIETQTACREENDLAGTPLECPFDLDVLKIQDEDFYSKESMESHHHSELKSCLYKPFSSFEARLAVL